MRFLSENTLLPSTVVCSLKWKKKNRLFSSFRLWSEKVSLGSKCEMFGFCCSTFSWRKQIGAKTVHFIHAGDANCFSWILSWRNIIKALQRQIAVSFPCLVIYMLWLSKSTINIVAPGLSNNGSKWWSSVWVRGVCVCVCGQAMHQGFSQA